MASLSAAAAGACIAGPGGLPVQRPVIVACGVAPGQSFPAHNADDSFIAAPRLLPTLVSLKNCRRPQDG
jgi:hypothetical protein